MEKLTNVKALEMVLSMDLSDELREKITKMKSTFEKKNSNGELTPTQKENLKIKDKIIEFLTGVDNGVTVTEVMKGLDVEYSNQKISSLLRQLVESGEVVRYEEKRKAYFKLGD